MSPWTVELHDKLVQIMAEKKTCGEAAKILGLSRNQVVGRVFRSGIKIESGRNQPNTARKYDKKSDKCADVSMNKIVGKPERKPPQHFALRKSVVEPLKVSVLDLANAQCRSVVDGETDDDCLPGYCGHPKYG